MPSTLLQKLQLKLPKLNTCAPSTKKGRFSGKNVSNAERLRTAGSTSTWPKSGLNVALSVRFEVTRSRRSSPALGLGVPRVSNGVPASDASDDDLALAYGMSSRCDDDAGMRRPTRCPKRDGPPASFLCQNDQSSSSSRRLMKRRTSSPHTCSGLRENRSWLYGMRISAVHPSGSMRVAASQIGSHDWSQHDVPMP